MIKDKIIELDNGINYYILEETMYKNKKYLLAVECDTEKDDVKEDYIVMEVKIEKDELTILNINDNNIAMIVTEMLLEKIRVPEIN